MVKYCVFPCNYNATDVELGFKACKKKFDTKKEAFDHCGSNKNVWKVKVDSFTGGADQCEKLYK